MSLRAIVLGFAAGLAISSFTFFNDMVMGQTRFIGSALPISVFGGVTLWVLVINPMLGAWSRRAALAPPEIALVAALALAACSFPGQGFFQYFTIAVGLPGQQAPGRTNWQATHVMSYLPGGSAELGHGHVTDWPALLEHVRQRRDAGDDSVAARLWSVLEPDERSLWRRAWEADGLDHADRHNLLRSLNAALGRADFAPGGDAIGTEHRRVAHGRAWLVDRLPELIRPPPRGITPVLAGGRYDEHVVGSLHAGLHTGRVLPVREVPWRSWAGPAVVWLGGTLMLSLAAVAMAVIVHPQWSRREMLAFPIPRFLEVLTRREPGQLLPATMRSRLFWGGFAAVLGFHLINGLHNWFPALPPINRAVDLMPLRDLFENARQVPQSHVIFYFAIFPSVAAFAYFIARPISLSLGLAPILFVILGSVLVGRGVLVSTDRYEPSNMNFFRLGAYAAVIALILYTGRAYYLEVVKSGLGLASSDLVTPAVRWASRAMVLFAAAGGVFYWAGGLSPLVAAVLVVLVMGTWLVLARITSETGMFLLAGPFLPLGIIPALFGEVALGPTQMLLLGVIGFILLGDAKESLMTYIVNGLEMRRRLSPRPAGRTGAVAIVLAVMVVLGAIVAGVVSVSLHYEHGTGSGGTWWAAEHGAAFRGFDHTARLITELLAWDRLGEAVGLNDWQRLARLRPDGTMLAWAMLGAALVAGTALARLRIPGWPLHPVAFLLMGTWGINMLWASFLLGWLIKTGVVRLGGERAYLVGQPLAVGVIAGELLGGLFWIAVGILYYAVTGQRPEDYSIFPV